MKEKMIKVSLGKLRKAGSEAVRKYPESSNVIMMYIRIREAWEAGRIPDVVFSTLREQVQEKFKERNIPWKIWYSQNEKKLDSIPTVCPSCGKNKPTVERPMIVRVCFGILCNVRVCESCNPYLTDFDVLKSVLPMNRWTRARRFVYGSNPRLDGKMFSPVVINDITGTVLNWKEFKQKNYGHGFNPDEGWIRKRIDEVRKKLDSAEDQLVVKVLKDSLNHYLGMLSGKSAVEDPTLSTESGITKKHD